MFLDGQMNITSFTLHEELEGPSKPTQHTRILYTLNTSVKKSHVVCSFNNTL
jgi:hypothetical protein